MAARMHPMRKHDKDRGVHALYGWPGPVGWWYLPLIWAIIALVAGLAWALR